MRHVLVVDDDLDIRETIAELLEDHGITVTTAINGRDALEKLNLGTRPDLILLDLMMPILDGRAFCEELRARSDFADLPIVILSADREVEAIARDLDVAAYLPKPFELQTLVEAVERYSRVD